MEFFRIKKDIPFMRHALVFNVISLITFILAVVFLFTRGLHLSIEFTGGTLIEVAYTQSADVDKLRKQLEIDGFADPQVQSFGSSREVLIRVPAAKGADANKVSEVVVESLKKVDSANQPELKRVEFVGPQVGTSPYRPSSPTCTTW
jgi:preprotein translocase subunit SecF